MADAVRNVDWTAVLLSAAPLRTVDLNNWQIEGRHVKRFWATYAKSLHDYLTEDGTSVPMDNRRATEGASLKAVSREAKHEKIRWSDADVLT